VGLVGVLGGAFDVLLVRAIGAGRTDLSFLVGGWMWSPGLAALATLLICGRGGHAMGLRPGRPWYLLLGYAAPFACGICVYGVVLGTGAVGFHPPASIGGLAEQLSSHLGLMNPAVHVGTTLVYQGTVGLAAGLPFALGEELGWRGFLTPRLFRITSFERASLSSGLLVAIYHYPLILWAGYNSGAPWWQNLGCFTGLVVSSAFVLTWLRMRSGSVWPAVLAHAAHNALVQDALDPLAAEGAARRLLLGEFGLALPLAAGVLALYVWTKRGALYEVAPSISSLAGHS
jgi:membrane protease YdiL (CAAX protease family)